MICSFDELLTLLLINSSEYFASKYRTHTPVETNDEIKTKRNKFSLFQDVDVEESIILEWRVKIFLSIIFNYLHIGVTGSKPGHVRLKDIWAHTLTCIEKKSIWLI